MEMPQPAPKSLSDLDLNPKPAKIPTTPELFAFFNQFLDGWMKLSAQMAVGIGDEIPNLPLERGLLFSKPFNGILVIRTLPEFESHLQKVEYMDSAPSARRDLFMELFILFWHRFVSKFWNLDSRLLPPSLFKKSIPADWPDRKSDALLQVFVANHPLVIRLWTSVTDEEMSHWRSPKN